MAHLVSDPQALASTYRKALLEDTLPFWIPRAVDEEHGGFLIARDRDGSLLDTDKGMWQQCRFAWLLGKLYNTVEPREEWLRLCAHGLDFVDRHGRDEDGRMWFHVTRDGAPIRKRRYAFTEAFAAIAYGEYARATGKEWAVEKAYESFRRFVEHEPYPKLTRTRPLKSIGLPMIKLVTAQELRESIELPNAELWIDRAIEEIRADFIKPDLRAVLETVLENGEVSDHFEGRTLNPGHAIEAAWFLMREGRIRGDEDLVQLGTTVLDWSWERGWDTEHGGLLYFVDLHGGPVQEYWHDMKFWWPQCEAIIATLLAYSLTGDERYAEWHGLAHEWAQGHFADAEHGEWFGYLHRDGSRSSTVKGNLWKGPFHLPRMQLECWRLAEGLKVE
jgi:N-acylglucosamine 2-epimerase